ncbi:ClpX C4-type zinc finger protein [Paenibacillus eucommiae]|uniref:ClpX-type ZB domain-containing protein n=1 Tax=Paenibacillus eucommiae TaxID=1355755 RepID=A0ABS4IUC3_9BACL|nr:ClpX C4-type zinc finger protein [Paenibacillus eucommiae]MBP1991108.1 hypothetical protein [Paenibacillus eucommiae]
MTEDFRKKNFRGAKIEDMIDYLEAMIQDSEKHIVKTDDPLRQRFFEGMTIAYTMIAMKLKNDFDYKEFTDKNVSEHIYQAVIQMDMKEGLQAYTAEATTGAIAAEINADAARSCSFCSKTEDEVQKLVHGPNVAICNHCLDFGKQLLEVPDEQK